MTRTAGVAELKASLSSYLRGVKAGDEVVITERGRPIARLTPLAGERWPGRTRQMAAAGRIRMGSGKLAKGFWQLPRPKDPKGLVVRALLLEREGGR